MHEIINADGRRNIQKRVFFIDCILHLSKILHRAYRGPDENANAFILSLFVFRGMLYEHRGAVCWLCGCIPGWLRY